jgi:hypothetical protein
MNETAGLKCAPLKGPSSAINEARTATVAPVLAINAMPRLPPARRSAMIPEPTTVAARSNDPRPSASSLLGSGSECIVHISNRIHPVFDAKLINARNR